jgi:hypothetical protein
MDWVPSSALASVVEADVEVVAKLKITAGDDEAVSQLQRWWMKV